MERARWTNSKQFRQKKSLPDPKRRRTENAASFKHVSPAGAAVAVPLSETLKKMYSPGGNSVCIGQGRNCGLLSGFA